MPERVAMQLTGHRSRAIFDRYCIVAEAELHQAGARLCAYLARPPAPPVTLGVVAGPGLTGASDATGAGDLRDGA